MEKNHIIVLTTTSSREEAEKIAHALLAERLIACANIIGPIHSLFWWQDKIDTAQEHLILMKTRKALFSKVSERIKAIHSYQVPEVIALPIMEGSKDYLKWLDESLDHPETCK
ncbi:MAG: divalent-cation tolerance protein CutA [Candidatus Bathyarchaeia archaeon]